MNFIKKIILVKKNLFYKEKVKEIESTPKIYTKNKRKSFIKSLNVSNEKNIKNKKVKTLICEGDGLGIQREITY